MVESPFQFENSFFKFVIYKNILFPKLMFCLSILIIFKLFSEFVTFHKLTKNLPPLICLYLPNCRSKASLWKRVVRTYLCRSLSNSDSEQDVAFRVVMRARDVFLISQKFGQVDHCSIHCSIRPAITTNNCICKHIGGIILWFGIAYNKEFLKC